MGCGASKADDALGGASPVKAAEGNETSEKSNGANDVGEREAAALSARVISDVIGSVPSGGA